MERRKIIIVFLGKYRYVDLFRNFHVDADRIRVSVTHPPFSMSVRAYNEIVKNKIKTEKVRMNNIRLV